MTDLRTKKWVVITGGGTGGHLYPGLAVAEEFRRREAEILYLGTSQGLEAEVVPREGFAFRAVPARGLTGGFFKQILALSTLGWGVLKSLFVLRAWHPDLIVGTGGFVSVPAVVAGKLLGVPVLLLEQNAVAGRATKLLSKFAECVCLSFQETSAQFSGTPTVWTGNPLRSSIERRDRRQACEKLGLDPSRPTLLVTGASQGAASINQAVLNALPKWKDKAWNVVHLTGRNHLARISARVEGFLQREPILDYRCYGFRNDMETLYSVADLVVSRAGATTMAELTCLGIPAIFVPYPHAGGHQIENARQLLEVGGAEVIADEAVADSLADVVAALLENKEALNSMAERCRQIAQPQASQNVCDVCFGLMK